ncbi:hypothetical protein ACJMK2_007857 [Sinanodonta woodiana]|uniref:Zinc finger PHD-type domain-containing protein n=1 Tax=Sinanodonta woodiana TaxID=1069815 RepID=A0ABD3VLD1_SINWO
MRDMVLSKADIAKSFLVRDFNGGLTLDRRHEHYYQVQCQLFRIEKCHAFWEDMLPKVLHVFRVGILPELLARCYRRLPLQDSKGATPGPSSAIDQLPESTFFTLHNSQAALEPINVAHQPSEPVWCFCQDAEYGQMVACDDQNCKFQWFHFGCVGITSKPKGKRFCPECIQSCSQSRINKVK